MSDRIIRKPADRHALIIEKRALEQARHTLLLEQKLRGDTIFANRIAELDHAIGGLRQEISEYDALRYAGLPNASESILKTIENLELAPRIIAQTRMTFDITFRALSEKLGTTESAMSRMEKTQYQSVSLARAVKIAKAIVSFRLPQ